MILLLLFVALPGVLLAACGKEIGDACVFSSDCSPNGDRQCVDPNLNGGYCSIQGCEDSTCPGEATCIRFFTGSFSNKMCDHDPADPLDPDHPQPLCSLDELCSLEGNCVPRSSEIRYCMRTCDSDGDCRDGYECRDIPKMIADGGEPVLASGQVIDTRGQVVDLNQLDKNGNPTVVATHAPKFCAAKPAAGTP